MLDSFASMAEKHGIILLATLNILFISTVVAQSEPSCEYANVKVTTPDGNSQVFTVKHLKPVSSECKHCASNSNDGGSLHYSSENLSTAPGRIHPGALAFGSSGSRSPELAPTVTVLVGEILSGCGWSKLD